MDNEQTQGTAELSTAGEAKEIGSETVENLTTEQRNEWLLNGTLPGMPKPTTGDSATPKKETEGKSEPEKKAEGEAASGTAQTGQEKPKFTGADKRKAQLSNDINDLLGKRRALREEVEQLERQKGVQPTTPPAATAERAAPAQGRPVRPKIDDFPSFDAYEVALDQYEENLADWKADQRIKAEQAKFEAEQRKRTIAETNQKIRTSWDARLAAARERHADWNDVCQGVELPLNPAMDAAILDSEHGPEIVYILAQDLERAGKIAMMSGVASVRAIVELEREVAAALGGNGNKPPQETQKGEPPKLKKVTNANPPPTQLSGRNTAPADEVVAAVDAGDFSRYRRVMNARDVRK